MLGDGRDHLPQDAGASDRLVLGPVPHEPEQERDLGFATEQGDRRLLPHRLADAAENSQGHGRPRPGLSTGRSGGGGRRHCRGRGTRQEAVRARRTNQVGGCGCGEAPRPRPRGQQTHSWIWVVPDASTPSLHGFLQANAQPGSTLLTDDWSGYQGIEEKGFQHQVLRRGPDPAAASHLFPWVAITLSNLKRFLLGAHHKAEPQHLKRTLAEFTVRLNRRSFEENLFHRLARACLTTNTITVKDLVATHELT